MNWSSRTPLLIAALAATAVASAQTPQPPTGTADPSAASSPHQRAATGASDSEAPATGSPEADAASTPHQHESASMKPSGAKLKMARQDGAVPTTFVKKAAQDGMTEVQLGKLALQKSQDAKVREFANRMVADHSKAGEDLASLAKSKNIDVPATLDAEHQSIVQTLTSKSGAAFDTAYSQHMKADHSEAIALFEGASKSSDKDLAAFARKTLPTLKEHKELADQLVGSRTAEAADSSGGAPR